MHPLNLIASHLDKGNLNKQIDKVDTICSFTGIPIQEGIANKVLIKPTFTDKSFLKFKSDYSSVDAALCIESVIQGKTSLNALRNYSYIATQSELKLLKREMILNTILGLKNEPFAIAVTYANKKHTAYKTCLNISKDNFVLTTDVGNIRVERKVINFLLPVLQTMYSIIPTKKYTAAQPTYFAKKEILSGNYPSYKMKAFGLSDFLACDKKLKPYYGSNLLKLLVFILNKS